MGTFGDPMKLLDRLNEAPLASSAQMGRFGLRDIIRSETGAASADGKPPPAASQIQAAFKDTSQDVLLTLNQALTDSVAMAHEIDEILTKTIGADKAPDLNALPVQLKEIQKRLGPYLPAGAVPISMDGNGAASSGGAGGAGSQPITGEIQTREDVVRMIEKICGYYEREEPSSPVPYILKRAERLAKMDFMQIIDDLTPESIKEIQRITGDKPKEE
jgi:type VI secretion system protein ImpA